MKKLSLATVLFLSTTTLAFADSNTLIIAQAPVGGFVPALNFTQSGTGALASIIQNGNVALTGVQVGTGGTKLNLDQENPTSGAVNTINYTGRGNSDVTIDQRAANGIFTASGSAGNTANVDMAGNAVVGGTTNKMFLDQVGYNNTATVYDTFAGYAPIPTYADNIRLGQYSDNASAGNQLQIQSAGLIFAGYILQKGGNKATFNIPGSSTLISLTQTNTADNIASANVANVTLNGAGLDWTQTGTTNDIEANLSGVTANWGLTGWQNGNGNKATVTQTNAYFDASTGSNQLYQTGNNNIATATQTNTHDSSFLIQQNGNGNNTTVAQTGTNNLAQVYQVNNNNIASVTQSGTGASLVLHQF